MFREEIKVLDCTIRDGGLINDYQFKDDLVKATYRAACEAAVDFFEIGKRLCESTLAAMDVATLPTPPQGL